MAEQKPSILRPAFQPRPEYGDLLSVHLLWCLAERVECRESGCWEWTGAKTKAGYGSIEAVLPGGGRVNYVHRLVCILCVSDLSPGMQVLHRCDNPCCYNPGHLFVGTQKDNIRDMDRKGRRIVVAPHGEACHFAKLTVGKVAEILARVANGEPSSQAMADEYGIHFSTLRRIITRKKWKHVK